MFGSGIIITIIIRTIIITTTTITTSCVAASKGVRSGALLAIRPVGFRASFSA
jgi:hypothetical protein